jgi:hypothetical protein
MPDTHHDPRSGRPAGTRTAKRGRSAGTKIAALTTAAILALLSFGFLAAGGALLWADGHKDEQGYFSTDSERFSTSTYALTNDEIDVDADLPGWIVDDDRFGTLRLEVTPRTDKPVFVGIAPTPDVDAYLRHTAHASVTDVDYSPFHAEYRTHRGGRPATAPSEQSFWAASAQGSDMQTVRWDVESGSWSIVVMNADGSKRVDAGVSAGAKVPFVSAIAWGSIGTGVLLAAAAVGLLLVGSRAPRPSTPAPELAPVAA